MSTEYRVLGALEITRAGDSVTVSAPKERDLLLSLLLRPNAVVPVDQLIEALWGSRAPSSAAKLVQLYVSNLRKALGGDSITTSAPGYRLNVDTDALDSQRFSRLLAEGRDARARERDRLAVMLFERALSLWRGSALADARYAEFAADEARRLEELRLTCLEELLATRLALGEHDRVLTELAGLSAEHPLREQLRMHLAVALYRAGRQAEALDVLRHTRRALRDELGLEAGEALRSLERAILRHDPELAPPPQAAPPSVRLPAITTALIGRERELGDLRALVQRADVRLLSLVGAGGTGKTRVALALAADCHGLFADGIAFVELAPLSAPELVLPAIAHALGVAESQGESLELAIAHWAADRELLLVLDNFEHVVAASKSLLELLSAAPRLTVVVTSRRVLHASGEHVFPVQPLGKDDAVALFLDRARAADASLAPTPDVADDIRAICERLDGLPLAIELAAARLRLLTSRQLLERLGERLTLLTSGPRDLPARQQTLRDTLEWSTALLSPDERQDLAGLSVFAGGCSLDAAAAVVGADLDRLGALVDHSLLQRDPAAREPRFGMLETVREYGLELLGAHRPELERAHAAYFADLAESADLVGPEQQRWLAELDEEQDNLRAAIDRAASSGDAETELRLAGALWRFWWLRGALAEGRACLERAIEHGRDAPPRLVAQACRGAAGLAWSQGDHPRARELGERGLEAASVSGEGAVELACHTVLGLVARDEADFDRARSHLEQSSAIATALGREADVVVAKMNLGSVAFDAGDHDSAVRLWEDVLAYHRTNGRDEGAGFALLNLGLAAYRLQRTEEAGARFREAEALFARIGFREHFAHALQGVAAVDAADGDALSAARLLGRATRLLAETGSAETTFDAALPREVEASARAQLGDEAFAAAFAPAGREVELERRPLPEQVGQRL